MKKILLGLMLCMLLVTEGKANDFNGTDWFRGFGDVFTLLPLYAGIASLAMQDYEGFGQVLAGSLVTQGIVEASKRSFELSAKLGHPVEFSRRPDGGHDYKGMPSGHSSGAFSGASYIFYRYGWKPGIPAILLATAVAASRVVAKRHTIAQVVTGAVLAWGVGYLFTTKYQKFVAIPSISSDDYGHTFYSLNFSTRF
ncbi:hypothetical protein BKH43_06520 [Helicobacter sp. 13S00401-1]|uniref:phosphatase PAP2 family protein n=1 Tax=Helicobacter sp. 13S00401-1 TaxID=1905758 RepID=UPI000BA7C48A|nr:phosphatase PAP2 family protein [Helicobacter sp. 13S00401-1]PAF49657.1 hypothetical protein BKH43_06520 [Helicobacter sp. 13S00401-1]